MLQCHTFLTSYCYRVIRVKGDSLPFTACSAVLTTVLLLRVGVIADPLHMTNECNQTFSPTAANGVNIKTGGINSTIHARKTKFSSPFRSHYDYDDTGNYGPLPVARTLSREDSEWKEKAHAAINTALGIMFNEEGWTREIIDGTDIKDVIESKRANKTNIFRIQMILNASTDIMMALLFDAFEYEPKWNPTVVECKIVKRIDNNTQLVYIVSAPACDGMVGIRDYVLVRERAAMENSYVISGISVKSFSVPENKNFIRGELGPSCYLLTPIPYRTNLCELRLLLNTNLNGWLSQESSHEAFKDIIKNYIKYLRKLLFEMPTADILAGLPNQPDGQDKK